MPVNSNALIKELSNAVTELTAQIRRQNKFVDDQEQKLKQQPANLRQQQDDQMALFDERRGLPRKGRARERAGQETLFGAEVGTGDTELGSPVDERLPPGSQDRPTTGRQRYQTLRQQDVSRRKALRAYATPLSRTDSSQADASDAPPNSTASMPPGSSPLGPGGVGLNDPIMPWLMMGNIHGAPGAIRNASMKVWQFQHGLSAASNAMQGVSQYALDNTDSLTARMANKFGTDPKTGESTALQTVRGGLAWAQDNQVKTIAGIAAATGAYKTIGSINDKVSTMRSIGEILGYQSGNRSVFGHQLGGLTQAALNGGMTPAELQGLSFETEKQNLMGRIPGANFGGGLSGAQASDILDTLGNQGFHNDAASAGQALDATGNVSNLANNFLGPMMKAFPALNAKDLGQFIEQTRYGAGSINDLRTALGDLGDMAQATNRTIGQITGSIQEYQQATAAQGGNTIAGAATAGEWIRSTGMMPDVLAKAVQSPLVQGMALSKSGIMPWALGQSGSQAGSAAIDAVTMMAGATGGFNQATTDQWGIKHSGLANQAGLIAQKTGMPIQQVEMIMKNPNAFKARQHLQALTDDQTSVNSYGNKLAGMGAISWNDDGTMKTDQSINWKDPKHKAQLADLNQQFNQQIDPVLRSTKRTDTKAHWNEDWKAVHQIETEKDPVKRLQEMQKYMTNQSGKEANTPGKTTVDVNINLKGKAAQIFTADKSVSQAKAAIQAGDQWNGFGTVNQAANSPWNPNNVGSPASGQPGSQWNPAGTPATSGSGSQWTNPAGAHPASGQPGSQWSP